MTHGIQAQPDTAVPPGASPEGVLIFESRDEQIQGWMDVRVQMDAAWYYENKNALHNGTELRRGRMGVHARIGTWDAELDVDLSDNRVDINDAYLQYRWSHTSLRVGQFKEPYSLERLTSSRYIPFMERALPTLPDALPVGSGLRKMGMALSGYGDRWHITGGIFGQDIGDDTTGDDEGYALTARSVLVPINTPRRVFHLGLSGTYRTPDANAAGADRVVFKARPETHVHRARYMSTGRISQVKSLAAYGFESALVWGPLYAQGEFLATYVQRKAGLANIRVRGGYIMASWALTGASKQYVRMDGEYVPGLSAGSAGTWEVAVRYSTLDLNDFNALLLGGEAEIITLGVNWYANRNVRLMVNTAYVNHDRHSDGGSPTGPFIGGDDFPLIQMRAQVHF